MGKAGASRGVLCVVLACSTTLSTFVAPVCACGPTTGRSPETAVRRQESMTQALPTRPNPCGRPCCSSERQSAGCCCRSGHSTASGAAQEPVSAPGRECVGCNCSTDHPSLPPSDTRLAHFETSGQSEPALRPQFAASESTRPARWPSADNPGRIVDLVITLSRRTC